MGGAGDAALERHPSLDERFDPAVRIVDYDPSWPLLAAEELRRIGQALGPAAARLARVGATAAPGAGAPPRLACPPAGRGPPWGPRQSRSSTSSSRWPPPSRARGTSSRWSGWATC